MAQVDPDRVRNRVMALLYACPLCYAEFRKWSACVMHFTTTDCKEVARLQLEEPELQEYCRAAAQRSWRAAVYGRAQLRALTLGGAVRTLNPRKCKLRGPSGDPPGTLSGPCGVRVHFAGAKLGKPGKIPANLVEI